MENQFLLLPYQGSNAKRIISSLRKQVSRAFPDNLKMTVSLWVRNLVQISMWKIKRVEHDILYYASVMRQMGESQNGYFKKTKHVKFFEKRTFLTPVTISNVRVRIWGLEMFFFRKIWRALFS